MSIEFQIGDLSCTLGKERNYLKQSNYLLVSFAEFFNANTLARFYVV